MLEGICKYLLKDDIEVALIRSIMFHTSVTSPLFALDVPIWLHGIQFHDLVSIILFIFF